MTDLTLTEQQAAQALATKQMTQDIAEAHETMGMIKAFNFVSKLLTVGTLKKLQEIKETKKYKGLSYLDQDGKLLTVGSFAEYCKACGLSDKKVWEDLTNLNTFGEEFIETSQRLGLGYREMRKLRQLPDEARTEIVEADYSETADKEDLLEKIEDLTSQHAKVKAELESKLKRKSEDYEAQAKLLDNKNKRIDQLDADLVQKAKLIDTMDPDTKGGELRKQTMPIIYNVRAILISQVQACFRSLTEHSEQSGIDHTQFMAGALLEIDIAIADLRHEFSLPSVLNDDPTPEWARDDTAVPDYDAEFNAKFNLKDH
jgi:hypothetical protein